MSQCRATLSHMEKQLLTKNDIADMCGVHLNTVHNWITRGELHAYKLGPRTVRVLPEDFAAFMERKQGGTNEEPAH